MLNKIFMRVSENLLKYILLISFTFTLFWILFINENKAVALRFAVSQKSLEQYFLKVSYTVFRYISVYYLPCSQFLVYFVLLLLSHRTSSLSYFMRLSCDWLIHSSSFSIAVCSSVSSSFSQNSFQHFISVKLVVNYQRL